MFLAMTDWTTFVRSRQSMQFVLKTPSCSWCVKTFVSA
jgi:hypothetical protein